MSVNEKHTARAESRRRGRHKRRRSDTGSLIQTGAKNRIVRLRNIVTHVTRYNTHTGYYAYGC